MPNTEQVPPPSEVTDVQTSLCRVCLEVNEPARLIAREMMFGTKERFDYEFCSSCGSLQIAEIPSNLAPYYPKNYYSHRSSGWRGLVLGVVKATWGGIVLYAPRPVLRVLSLVPDLRYKLGSDRFSAIRKLNLKRSARIADIGGGQGDLLGVLVKLGFRNLTCIDPFGQVEGVARGISFIRADLADVSGTFDLIIYSHVLEHVPDINVELTIAREHLSPGGRILARLPLLPNAAFDEFRENWVQLDAPRHLHIPSRTALATAVRRSGLRVVDSGSDSTEFQFWASQGYMNNFSLAESAHQQGNVRARFARDRRQMRRRADELNRQDLGDSGWYILMAGVPADR